MASPNITGATSLQNRLSRIRKDARSGTQAATAEAIELVQNKARAILTQEIYSKGGGSFDEAPSSSDSDSLYQAFVLNVVAIGTGVSQATLSNTSDHAGFIENGTDDEGTGSHFIPVGEKGVLAWRNGATGAISFSRGHEVKGIVPLRFMQRAMDESQGDIVKIFQKHLRKAL